MEFTHIVSIACFTPFVRTLFALHVLFIASELFFKLRNQRRGASDQICQGASMWADGSYESTWWSK